MSPTPVAGRRAALAAARLLALTAVLAAVLAVALPLATGGDWLGDLFRTPEPVLAPSFAAAKVVLPAARRTAVTAGVLLLAGMWGFLGMHVVNLLQLPAARLDGAPGAAALLEQAQADPVLGLMFLLPFLVGCSVGLLVLVVGLFRTAGLPRWIPAAWLLFLVLDFAVRPGGPVDPHWLFLAGAVGIAVQVLRGRVAAFA